MLKCKTDQLERESENAGIDNTWKETKFDVYFPAFRMQNHAFTLVWFVNDIW